MPLQLGQPGVGDEDTFFLRIVVGDGVAPLVRLGDHVPHVLVPQGAQDTEEEVALRQPVAKLFFSWQVLLEDFIGHRVFVHILDRYFLVRWHIHMVHLVLLQVQLLLAEDVAHEAELGAAHGRQEHVH